MSRLLSDLLGVDYRTLQQTITRLEHIAMQPSVDVRLTAEIITQVREKTRRLGLDPADTTARELYFALLSRAEKDDTHLRTLFRLTEEDSPSQAAQKIASHTQKLLKNDRVMTLQAAAVKKILKSVPPKKTLRILKFRSIDSVLKRENPYALYALAKKIEDKTWHKQLHARLKRLQSRDVGEQQLQVLALPDVWLQKLASEGFNHVLHPVPEIGSIVLLPSVPVKTVGAVLLSTMIILQAAQKMIIESFPFKLKTMQYGGESFMPAIAAGTLHSLEPIHGLAVSWHAVYKVVATQTKERMSDVEFIVSDLFWETSETRLSLLSSELDFWVNTHYLGVVPKNEAVVSLHGLDCAASLVLGRSYGEQVNSHLKASLWNEIQSRYLEHEALENALLPQLTMASEFMV